MILKASQRGGGQDLARHLMRVDDNEHMRLHELRGFAGETLRDAFRETEAIARGTRCKQYLFSLSLSPPEAARVSEAQFAAAIEKAESRLGLEGQPRAVVFHEKEGRRHAHCVWSRIDAETMTARPLPFFKSKLQGLSRELYLDHGWDMPRGFLDKAQRDPASFTLAEWQQAKRQGVDPRWQKRLVTDCWNNTTDRPAFEKALQDRGLFLARGDRRGHVVVDHDGEVYALSRQVGIKTKEVRARLGEGDDLRSVDATKALIAGRMTPAIRRHIASSRERFAERTATLADERSRMTERHRAARRDQDAKHKNAWDAELARRTARLPSGLAAVWQRFTPQYRQLRRENEAAMAALWQRQAEDRQALITEQMERRAALQDRIKAHRQDQAERLRELRGEIGRFLSFTAKRDAPDRGQSHDRGPRQGRGMGRGLRLER